MSGMAGRPAGRAVALTALALVGMLLAAAVPGSAGTARGAGRAAADRQLDRAMADLVHRRDGPPLALAVIQRGSRRSVHRVGVAELGRERPARARERMRIASTSKAISGGVALGLVDGGLLALDDTIGDWLPDQPAAWHDVTLAQLLNHTGGMPDFSHSDDFVAAVTASPDQAPPPRALLAYVADRPLEFPPGTDYAYSNSDNVAVGLIVQAATGNPYPRELRRRLFEPLGMGRSALGPNLRIPPPLIHGYEIDANRPADVSSVVDFGGWAWASGGVVSTPGNLNKYIRAYAGGRLFGAGVRAAQRHFVPAADSDPRGPGRNSAGLALFRYRTNCGTVFGHTGSILGYAQLIAASRNGRRSLTFTINTQVSKALLPALRRAERRAVCAALARG